MTHFTEKRLAIRILFAEMDAGEVAKIIADGYERLEWLERRVELLGRGQETLN